MESPRTGWPGLPVAPDTALVARDATERGVHIWLDRAGDERTDFNSPDPAVDILEVRVTANATGVFFLVKLAALPVASGDGAPQIQIAIDKNRIAGSGESAFVQFADTFVAVAARWEGMSCGMSCGMIKGMLQNH